MGITQHAVIGTGDAPAVAIKEGLLDVLDEGDVIGLVWTKPLPTSLEAVYDHVINDSLGFCLYYMDGENPPRVFRESPHGVCQKVKNSTVGALRGIEGTGKVLFLWNDEENDPDAPQSLIDLVFDNVAEGTIVLELTNALVPITASKPPAQEQKASRYDDDPPMNVLDGGEPMVTKTGKVLTDEDVEALANEAEAPDPFTRDELLNMPADAVKRYGARVGTKAVTKKGIIDELFPLETVEPFGATIMRESIEQNEATKSGIAPAALDAIDQELATVVNSPSALELSAHEALKHFMHMDQANAAFHCAEVRYSPITFRLAEALSEVWADLGTLPYEVTAVLAHRGQYPEDAGR